MSAIKSSFFRRLIYAAPGLIVIGGIVMIFDLEYGGAMMAVGVIGLIIGVITILKSRSQKRVVSQGYTHQYQDNTTYQSGTQQPLYQPQQQEQAPIGVQQSSKFCTSCGGKVDATMNNCVNCGAKI